MAATQNQTLCINTALTNITFAVGGGATGASVSGLPAGVNGNFSGGTFTISGTPTAAGTFNYTVTTTGGCSPADSSGGSIVVNPLPTLTLTSAVATQNQTLCINTALTNITYSVGGSATGASASGLPAGVNGNFSGGTFTISGTPTAAGTFNYTVTTTGGCSPADSSGGSIVVNPLPTLALTSAAATQNQTLCINTALSNITYSVGGSATGAGVIGLPAGVTGNFSGGIFTISGTPTAAGTFNYTVTTTGGCSPADSLNGSIVVNPAAQVNQPANVTVCRNTATPVTALTTSNSGGTTTYSWTNSNTAIGLAASGTGNIPSIPANTPGTATITVTPTYTNGGVSCTGSVKTFTITVNPLPSFGIAPTAQTICSANAITPIVFSAGPTNTYNWTRNNVVNGTDIPASGTVNGNGNISGTLTNTTTAALTVTFTITPITVNGCNGASTTATVIVNPTPNVTANIATQTICSGNPITGITLTGSVAATTFNWTRNNAATVTGIAASGSGNISGSLTNTTTAPLTVTFTITPTANGCNGVPITTTVLVNPLPAITAQPPATVNICAGTPSVSLSVTATGATTYQWRQGATVLANSAIFGGVNTAILTISNPTTAQTGLYTVVIGSAAGCTATSTATNLTVNPVVVITQQPANKTVCTNAATTFNVTHQVLLATSGSETDHL